MNEEKKYKYFVSKAFQNKTTPRKEKKSWEKKLERPKKNTKRGKNWKYFSLTENRLKNVQMKCVCFTRVVFVLLLLLLHLIFRSLSPWLINVTGMAASGSACAFISLYVLHTPISVLFFLLQLVKLMCIIICRREKNLCLRCFAYIKYAKESGRCSSRLSPSRTHYKCVPLCMTCERLTIE